MGCMARGWSCWLLAAWAACTSSAVALSQRWALLCCACACVHSLCHVRVCPMCLAVPPQLQEWHGRTLTHTRTHAYAHATSRRALQWMVSAALKVCLSDEGLLQHPLAQRCLRAHRWALFLMLGTAPGCTLLLLCSSLSNSYMYPSCDLQQQPLPTHAHGCWLVHTGRCCSWRGSPGEAGQGGGRSSSSSSSLPHLHPPSGTAMRTMHACCVRAGRRMWRRCSRCVMGLGANFVARPALIARR